MKPKQHLTLRGNTWYFNYRVPKYLQDLIGKSNIMKSLGTDSFSVAQKLRNELMLEIKSKEQSIGVNPQGARLRELVTQIRGEYESIRGQEEWEGFNEVYSAESEMLNGDKVKAAAILIAQEDGSSEALGLTVGYTIQEVGSMYVNHISGKVGDTTVRNTKRALKYLKEHSKGKDLALSGIARPSIVKFIEYLGQSIKPQTITTLLSCLNQVWGHAYDRGYTNIPSPFKGHKIKFERVKPDSKKPFTIEQWEKLLDELSEVESSYGRKWIAPIALMTGMRIEEIAGLHKNDVYQESNGRWFFNVHDDKRRLKTKAAVRKVPLHSSIEKAVLKLKFESENDFLLPEVVNSPSNRSGAIGSWFSRIKVKHITKDKAVSFHSLRGMFITAMENASVDEGVAASIVGHKKNTLTYGLYSDGVKADGLCGAVDRAGYELRDFILFFPVD